MRHDEVLGEDDGGCACCGGGDIVLRKRKASAFGSGEEGQEGGTCTMEFKKLKINFQAKSFTPTLNFGSNWGTAGGTSRFPLGKIPEQSA